MKNINLNRRSPGFTKSLGLDPDSGIPDPKHSPYLIKYRVCNSILFIWL